MKHLRSLALFGCAGVKQNAPKTGSDGGTGAAMDHASLDSTAVCNPSSSWRQGMVDPTTGSPIAQLFMTVIVKPETGLLQTYPAVYLWNQPANISNFTPAWDVFKIGSVG